MKILRRQITEEISAERIFAFLLLFSTITALLYRFSRLDFFTIIIALVSSAAVSLILWHFKLFFNVAEPKLSSEAFPIATSRYWLATAGLGVALILAVLWSHRSADAIVTPWELLPDWLFIVYFGVILSAFFSLKSSPLSCWLVVLASFSVIPIIYSLGYGYDFFIHEASLREIAAKGAILPKTNFYFGQYALLLIANMLFHLPYFNLHLWLVPMLSIVLLPWVIIKNTGGYFERISWLLILALPYAFLTFTTPQNLGLLLLLLEIILLSRPTKNNLLLACFLALFNLTIHPISAIPGVAILLLTYLVGREVKGRIIFTVSALLPLAIPLLLLMTSAANWTGYRTINNLFLTAPFSLPDSEGMILNLTYAYFHNLPIVLAVALLIAYYTNRNKIGTLIANVSLSLGLLGTVILMQFIELHNVIAYEQADYSRRLLLIAILMALPILARLLRSFMQAIFGLGKSQQLTWLVFLAGTLTASFYLSYPRHDYYFNSRGLSVSRGDLEAVDYIEARAKGQSYAVLANQQVSAASLSRFGFAHYYNNNFYYPIPTTNPLYQHYLDMVYQKPSRQTADEASKLMGVDRIYFVLNKYWLNFPKILEEAKLSADSYQAFQGGRVYVFEYGFDSGQTK